MAGVEPKIPPPFEVALLEGCPKLKPPDAGLLAPPNSVLEPLLAAPPPNADGA